MIIDYFHYNGKSMLHLNHRHIFSPWQNPAKFQEDLAKLVGGAVFTRYPVSICFVRSCAKK